MNKRLRILHLEDEPDFSSLVSALLDSEGLDAEIVLVTNFKSFKEALEKDSFDIILADYTLPTCNGLQALEVAREKHPEVPFVLLSGAIGEHAAIDFLRSGANDYVMKSYLERLVPAIRRAVQEAQEHSQLQHAEAEASEGEMKYCIIFETSPVCMWVSDRLTGGFLDVNPAAIRRYGFTKLEFLSMTDADISSPPELAKLRQYQSDVANEGNAPADKATILCQHRTKEGTRIDVEITCSRLFFNGRNAILTMAQEISGPSQAAEALKPTEKPLAGQQRAGRRPVKKAAARKAPGKKSPRAGRRAGR
jgi:PAS domain S-box-containing protein